MWFIFHIDLFYDLFTVSDVSQGRSLILPSGNLPGEGGVVPFRDDNMTNIRSKYRSNTSFCSELNVEHVGESFVSILVFF